MAIGSIASLFSGEGGAKGFADKVKSRGGGAPSPTGGGPGGAVVGGVRTRTPADPLTGGTVGGTGSVAGGGTVTGGPADGRNPIGGGERFADRDEFLPNEVRRFDPRTGKTTSHFETPDKFRKFDPNDRSLADSGPTRRSGTPGSGRVTTSRKPGSARRRTVISG